MLSRVREMFFESYSSEWDMNHTKIAIMIWKNEEGNMSSQLGRVTNMSHLKLIERVLSADVSCGPDDIEQYCFTFEIQGNSDLVNETSCPILIGSVDRNGQYSEVQMTRAFKDSWHSKTNKRSRIGQKSWRYSMKDRTLIQKRKSYEFV